MDNIQLRPAISFACFKTAPFLLIAILFWLLAYRYFPMLVWLSIFSAVFGFYRFRSIRSTSYLITPEVIRISRGIFFKRTDQVELWRVKDYIVTQSFFLQLFHLMDLTLKGTDPENPVVLLRAIPSSDLVDILRHRVNLARQHNRLFELN